MADNDDESNMSGTITVGGTVSGSASQVHCVSESTAKIETPALPLAEFVNNNQCSDKIITSDSATTVAQGSTELQQTKQEGDSQVITHILGSDQTEHNIITSIVGTSDVPAGTEYTTISADLVNALSPQTTIIYVQPDGSFVEGSGLTAEEQQQLVEQLAKQQIVQVSETEAARLFEHNQVVKTMTSTSQFVPGVALAPNELQQVIDQVTKSQQQSMVQVTQQQAQVPRSSEQVLTTVDASGLFTVTSHGADVTVSAQPQQNASQQLKNVAKHVAQQSNNGTRVVQKKPEPIRIQVQLPPKQEVKPLTSITIPQQKTIAVNQSQVKVSTNGSTSSPQIIHIQPMIGQQQQFFLQQNPGEPPIQLLLQSPGTVVGSMVPVVHKLPGTPVTLKTTPVTVQTSSPVRVQVPAIKSLASPLTKPLANSGPVKVPAPVAVAVVAASAKPAPPPSEKNVEKEKPKVKKRVKKPLKIKTRSGRVSRPPKHKARDYKFIKTEDLADSHQSDSDDYSEMSMGDEEGEEGKREGSSSSSSAVGYGHKQRAHKCKTCEKAYIGHGGLNRHYRLNPSHGEPDPESSLTLSDTQDPVQKVDTPTKKAAVVAGHTRKEGEKETSSSPVADEHTKASEKDGETKMTPSTDGLQKSEASSGPAAAAGLRQLHSRGPGRPPGRGRGRGRGRGKGRVIIPPKVLVGLPARRGRRGRPPKLGGVGMSTEQLSQRRKDRLKEVVQQCEDEELVEVVLPHLTKAVSVWEFLLAKVEKGRPSKAHFPDMYGEFETLQGQVKKMAQEYISHPQGIHTALEVHNIEVAKSLGIFDEVNKLKVLPGASHSSTTPATKNVRYMENSKMLPPSKRFKMENRAGELNSVPIQQNGIQKANSDPPKKVDSPTPPTLKACSVSVLPLVVAPGSKLKSSPSPTTAITPSKTPQSQPSTPDPTTTITPMEMLQDHLSNSLTQGGPGGADGEGEAMETEPQNEPLQAGLKGVPGVEDPCQVQILSTSDIAAQMKELEKALGSTEPVEAGAKKEDQGVSSSRDSAESSVLPQKTTDTSLPLQPAVGSPDSQPTSSSQTQPSSLIVPQQSARSQAASPARQPLSTESQGIQEGQEIYIQTEGLTMQLAEGPEGEAGTERIVIVNGPDGTTMHIRAPEGVPLEAVHALLGIEASEAKKQP